MAESPIRNKPTSRVIDSLHSEIDRLKTELEDLRLSHGEHKKKASILSAKNESLVDQLANCKHENDMINALLKRKERRIADLEEQFNELCSLNDSLKLSAKNLKIRCENLQESSASSTAEYERLKIAYDAMIASQNEYKRHYQEELSKLATLFESYKATARKELEDLSAKLSSNDKDMDTMIDSLTNKRKVMDNLYVNRNKAVLDLLATLARAAKLHGEESRVVLKENVDTIKLIREMFPEMRDKIGEHEPMIVDLDELVSESATTLDPSFAELESATNDEAPKGVHRNTLPRRRKHKRQSMRVSPESSTVLDETIPETLPSLGSASRATSDGRLPSGDFYNGPQQHNTQFIRFILGQRQSSTASNSLQSGVNNRTNHRTRGSQSAPQDRNGYRSYSSGQSSTSSNSSGQSSGPSNSSSNKHKRKLFYGGSSSFNSGFNDRKNLGKADI